MKKTLILIAALCFVSATPPHKPKVLIIGDSISMGYIEFVREILHGVVDVVRPEGNHGGTLHGIEKIDEWLASGGGNWDVIQFNFGLHDLKHVDPETGEATANPNDPPQQTIGQYVRNLDEMISKMQKTGARVIFATTTPVHGIQPNPYRDSMDVVRYNEAAVELCNKRGVAVNDLNAYVLAHPKMMRKDNVHFYPQDSRAIAGQVSNAILNELSVAPKKQGKKKR